MLLAAESNAGGVIGGVIGVVVAILVKRPLWWIILMLIPCVNIIVFLIIDIDLSKAFGHGTGFALGLFFLAPIFLIVLGFGSSRYQLEPEPLF